MTENTAQKPRRRPVRDDGWRLPDELWAKMEPLLPPRSKHPLGCHNPRVPDRRAIAAEFGFTLHLRTRGEEIRAKRRARAKARRWVVERTHSWLNRFRAVLIRWNKKPANYLALLHFAFGVIAWRHALPGQALSRRRDRL